VKYVVQTCHYLLDAEQPNTRRQLNRQRDAVQPAEDLGHSRCIFRCQVKIWQSGQLLDQGPGGLTIVEDGKIIFDGTEDTAPDQ
jgi:hypothetical protein